MIKGKNKDRTEIKIYAQHCYCLSVWSPLFSNLYGQIKGQFEFKG